MPVQSGKRRGREERVRKARELTYMFLHKPRTSIRVKRYHYLVPSTLRARFVVRRRKEICLLVYVLEVRSITNMATPVVNVDPVLLNRNNDDADIFYDAMSDFSMCGIEADYDEDDAVAAGDGEKAVNAAAQGVNALDFEGSVIMAYLKALQVQLKKEFHEKKQVVVMDRWIIKELERFKYVLPCHRADFYCRKLGIKFHEFAYYKDVHVWLPHSQWGTQFMPPCPNCKCASHVRQYSFPEWPARRVFTQTGHYYIMTRRFACDVCCQAAADIEKKADKPSQTFMGWDSRSLPHMAYGRGERFPAHLSHRSGIDKKMMHLLRALLNRGIRPGTFADIITELHSIEYFEQMIDREYRLASGEAEKAAEASVEKGVLFSDFGDRRRYNGAIPTGRYFQDLFVNFGKSIGNFLENEANKWPVDGLCIDTSYYITKILCRYHGKKVFDGLFSGTSTNIGHVRIQSYVQGEGHDQARPLLNNFTATQRTYGHPFPRHVFSDMPARDESLIHETIPSVKEYQDVLDSMAALQLDDEVDTVMEDDSPQPLSTPTLSPEDQMAMIRITDTLESTSNFATALLASKSDAVPLMGKVVLSLDTECDTTRNARGDINWSGAPELLQIGFSEDGVKKAWLIPLQRMASKIPPALKTFLTCPKFEFVGVNVGHDVKALEKKYKTALEINIVSLGVLARERGAVLDGRVSLKNLSKIVLKENMEKDMNVRCSKWSKATLKKDDDLSTRQRIYSAMDVIKPLEIHEKLLLLPDLHTRLDWSAAIVGMEVDIFPATGSIAAVSVCAVGVIKSITPGTNWIVPDGLATNQKQRRLSQKEQTLIVTLQKVYAAGLKIPYVTRCDDRRGVTLGDLASVHSGPFDVLLSARNLSKHLPDRSKLSAPILFGDQLKAAAPHAADSTDCVEDGATEQQKRKGVINPYPRKKKATSSLDTSNEIIDADIDEQDNVLEDVLQETIDIAEEAGTNRGFDYALLDLNEADLQWISVCLSSDSPLHELAESITCDKLDKPPKKIYDKFKATQGDGYHGMSRPKVPVMHSLKKAFYIALMEAWYTWEPEKFGAIVEKLSTEGKSKKEIENIYIFNTSTFLACCPRVVPPPSILYWRLRAVFAFYGTKVCPHTSKPLFNDLAWAKVNNLLKEVLDGYYSDIPGIAYYRYRINEKGEQMFNSLGFAMIECWRGTSDTEAVHRQIRVGYRSWTIGVELSHRLLTEFCHRYNQKLFERRIVGFPKIGHFNTWLLDLSQNLIGYNHGICFCPNWSNASAFETTDEKRGVVPLHSKELGEAINRQAELLRKRENTKKTKRKECFDNTMTRDQKFLAERTGLGMPCLPFYGEAENKLFNQLMMDRSGNFDANDLCLEWTKHCDAKCIFPKLPFYMRSHHTGWKRNRAARQQVETMSFQAGAERLKKINRQSATSMTQPVVDAPLAMGNNSVATAPLHVGIGVPITGGGGLVIGGISVAAVVAPKPPAITMRQQGERGADTHLRTPRKCVVCSQTTCPGKMNKDRCSNFCSVCRGLTCPGKLVPLACTSLLDTNTDGSPINSAFI